MSQNIKEPEYPETPNLKTSPQTEACAPNATFSPDAALSGKVPSDHRKTKRQKKQAHKKRRTVRRFLLLLAILLTGYICYSIVGIFVSPDRNLKQMYLIPKDAVFIIQSSEPVADWKRFSGSNQWKSLSITPVFADIAQQASSVDSIVNENKTLLSLVGKRDITISLHKTGSSSWDFLAIVDLQKVSKIKALKEQIGQILQITGNRTTERTYNGINIIEMYDAETASTLNMAFVGNHLIASYDPMLIHASIDERNSPLIGLDRSFLEAERSAGTKGICRIFINYAYLPGFLSIYMTEKNEYIDMFSSSMEYAGLSLDIDKDVTELKGYTIMKDEANPYITALLNSGRGRIKAQEILSSRTALYANFGFSSPSLFLKELEKAMQQKDSATFDAYRSARGKIEKYFDISLEKNFIDWMDGEFALAQLEPGSLGLEPELILAIRARNIKDAKKNMEFIEKRITRRSPVKIKNVEYKGYPINYIELKGFFRLFFGALFDKFEKPFYTYIDDYVVFSNRASTLLSFVEDYEQDNVLKKEDGFKTALSRAENSSTAFIYANAPALMPLLRQKLQPQTRTMIDQNLEAIYSFPNWVIQVGGDRVTSMKFIVDYDKESGTTKNRRALPETNSVDADSTDTGMNVDAQSERELMSELKRFYLEKFEGNVMREYYPGGTLKSEQEMNKGLRHGRFREYYEDGKLRVRGKYANDVPNGTWKYYTAEGKFDRKEKY